MGVGIPGAVHLLKLARHRPLGGSILTLGVQDTLLTPEDLQRLGGYYGMENACGRDWSPEINQKDYFRDRNYITGESFWRFLGFDEVVTTDFSGFENADVILDLNLNPPPPELRNGFDVVFDGGTLEHVFHLPNAMLNLHEMVKTGGLIIHQSPSSNHTDHGFYMFSPTFFQDFYSANRYRTIDFKFFMYTQNSNIEPTWWMDYHPGALAGVCHTGFEGIPGKMFAIACAFEKGEESVGDQIPQQWYYRAEWKAE